MATVLVIGSQTALLEGISQTLTAAGHTVRLAASIPDVSEDPDEEPALVIVADRESVEQAGVPSHLIAPGGALILYRGGDGTQPPQPTYHRTALADLYLPLERKRLTALIAYVEDRARVTGRGVRQPPVEQTRGD